MKREANVPEQAKQRRLRMVYVSIDKLHPDPGNPRRMPDSELEALTQSIKTQGFVRPVLARREDPMVISGHQSLVAARRVGLKVVPVIFIDISLEGARVLGLALNLACPRKRVQIQCYSYR